MPLTGPGPLTDTEFARLLGTIGQPAALFKLQPLERAKLRAVRGLLITDMKMRYKTANIKVPLTREEEILADLKQKHPDRSSAELYNSAINTGLIRNDK